MLIEAETEYDSVRNGVLVNPRKKIYWLNTLVFIQKYVAHRMRKCLIDFPMEIIQIWAVRMYECSTVAE